MKIISTLISICFIVCIASCAKEVFISLPETAKVLSISGGVTHFMHLGNERDTIQQIILTESVDFYQSVDSLRTEIPHIKNATVRVTDGAANYVFLYHDSTRTYRAKMPVAVGKKYTIYISYNGNEYMGSDSVVAPIAIDSLKAQLQPKARDDTNSFYRAMAYFVNPTQRHYFYWESRYIEVREDSLKQRYIYNYNSDRNTPDMRIFDNRLTIGEARVDSATVGRRIYPKDLIDTMTIVGIQYSTNAQTFQYQALIVEALGGTGPLGPPKPNIRSNVVCLTDPKKMVAGYFMAASADIKQIRFIGK